MEPLTDYTLRSCFGDPLVEDAFFPSGRLRLTRAQISGLRTLPEYCRMGEELCSNRTSYDSKPGAKYPERALLAVVDWVYRTVSGRKFPLDDRNDLSDPAFDREEQDPDVIEGTCASLAEAAVLYSLGECLPWCSSASGSLYIVRFEKIAEECVKILLRHGWLKPVGGGFNASRLYGLVSNAEYNGSRDEASMQETLVRRLRAEGFFVHSIPNEIRLGDDGLSSARNGAALNKMGRVAGAGDLLVHWLPGLAGYIECKMPQGSLTEEQEAFQQECEKRGIPYDIVRSSGFKQFLSLCARRLGFEPTVKGNRWRYAPAKPPLSVEVFFTGRAKIYEVSATAALKGKTVPVDGLDGLTAPSYVQAMRLTAEFFGKEALIAKTYHSKEVNQ